MSEDPKLRKLLFWAGWHSQKIMITGFLSLFTNLRFAFEWCKIRVWSLQEMVRIETAGSGKRGHQELIQKEKPYRVTLVPDGNCRLALAGPEMVD